MSERPDLADLSPAQRRALLAELLSKRPAAPRTCPASFAQQQFWMFEQFAPVSGLYNLPLAARFRRALDIAVMERSLNEIVRRHEALRTTFSTVAGEPVQIIAPSLSINVPVVDLRSLPEAAREDEVRRRAAEEARRPFDLARGPLVRATLLRTRDDETALLATMHHIVGDGWSIGVLMREALALYDAFSRGATSPLPELAIQYADYAVWQRQWLAEGALSDQLAYWRSRLAGAPVLELPTDRPRPAVPTFRGSLLAFSLGPELTARLKDLSRREGVTLFMVLLAGFQALLARYSGQDDIVVASLVAGRTRVETESLIGCFVNAVAMRTDCAGDPSFRDLLGRVREVCLEAYAHQDLPFEKVVEALRPPRDPSRPSFFQVMLLLQDASFVEARSVAVHAIELDTETAEFDLNLCLTDEGDRLGGTLRYSTDLFDRATMLRLVGHFETLLEAAIATPTLRISALPLLSEPEREQLLALNRTELDWRTADDETPGETLADLLAAQVHRTPDAVAVEFEGEEVTYRQLGRRADRLARRLRALGVGPEVRVGVYIERSVDLVVALAAILRAGGAYVPLEVEWPLERLSGIIGEAGISVVLSRPGLAERLSGTGSPVLCVEPEPAAGDECVDVGRAPIDPDNLAYVIYTSGSTGRPKGAMITHRGVCNRLLWMQEAYRLRPEDRVLQKTPLGFDVSVWELFWPLIVGARLVIARPGGHRDPAYLAQVIRDRAVTALHFVPPMLQAFLQDPGSAGCRSLRLVVSSGEALPPQLVESFFDRLGAQLHNLYGPTEASVDVTAWRCAPGERVVLIGRPIANTLIRVLDARLEPVPIGVVGEIHIGGVQVARGYVDRPDLTAERFIPDPFGGSAGERLYRTGDLARYRPDGSLEYLGRVDHQVKIRGMRVETGEIEAALTRHPGVGEVVVAGRRDPTGERRLVAYLVGACGPSPDAAELRDFLRQTLPEHMIPQDFVRLPALPTTANGKVDRRALPEPERVRPDEARAPVAPRDDLERQIAEIWENLLDVRPIGVTDGFFELGGHSLLAVKMMLQVRERWGQDLPLSALIQGATVERLARIVQQRAGSAPGSPLVAIQPGGTRRPLFCIHAISGSALGYFELSRHLGRDQPVYGLQSPGLDDGGEPPTRIEDMAAAYVKAIRAVQAEGPYRLAGHSFGGLVAFEMARQLEADGQKVALLALLDSWPFSRMPTAAEQPMLIADLARELGLSIASPRSLPADLDALGPDAQAAAVLRWIEAGAGLPAGIGPAEARAHIRVFLALAHAVREYRPGLYGGHAVVLRAANTATGAGSDLAAEWAPLVRGGVETDVVPGDHFSMLRDPEVRILAERLRVHLGGRT